MNDGPRRRRIPWLYLVCVPVAILGALFSSRLVGRGWNWEAGLSNAGIIGSAAIAGRVFRRKKEQP